ncbi:MAG: hypothetical protein IJA01_06460 [Firmicutes bacterium]|nr:hypothetical protein [Bacillota bacterium]
MDSIYKLVNELLEYIDTSDLNDILKSENENVFHLINKMIIEVSEEVKKGSITTEKIIDRLNNKYDNAEKFLNVISSSVDNKLEPYHEMSFFRKMDISEQKNMLQTAFEHMIIHVEDPSYFYEKQDIDANQMKYVVKMLNTVSIMVVENNVTKQYYCKEMYDMFGLNEDVMDIIWEMYQENISQLRYNQLFKYLKRQEEFMERLVEDE